MNSIKQCYSELLSLTQLFILREYALKDFSVVDPAVLPFFQKKMNKLNLPSSHTNTQLLSKTQPSPQNGKVQVQPKIMLPLQTPSQSSQSQTHQTQPPSSQPPQQPSQQPQPPQLLQFDQIRLKPEPLMAPPAPPQTKSLHPSPQTPDKHTHFKKSKQFSLEPWTGIPAHNTEEFWKIGQTLFPDWKLCETIPSDAIAQKNKNAWLKNQDILPVLILSFNDNEQQLAFLKNIAHAISLRLAPARVLSAPKLEKENSWTTILNSPQLRLVIANDYGLYLQPALMNFYREVPQQNKHFLNQTPLLLLSDLSLYLKEPQLKPLLWRAICNEFAALQQ